MSGIHVGTNANDRFWAPKESATPIQAGGYHLFILLLSLLSCNQSGFDAVAIRPIYGWTDGCTAVTITGRGFGDDVTAKIGDQALTGVTVPPADDIDHGYAMTGVMPASNFGKGYADVTVTSGDKSSVITGSGAYYYVDCPQPGYIEALSVTEGLATGTTVNITGCGLDSAALKVQLFDADGVTAVGSPIALTSVCGTANVSFTAPAVPADGTYYLTLVDGAGTVLAGAPCPPLDSADTASTCSDFKVTYGGSP